MVDATRFDVSEEVLFDGRRVRCFSQRPRNLQQVVTETVARRGSHEAYVCAARRETWREADALAASLAAAWHDRGVRAGDRVALLMGNSIDFAIACLAAIRMGAIAVPMSTRMQTDEIAYVLSDCGACLLVHDEALAARVPAADAVLSVKSVAFEQPELTSSREGSVSHESAGEDAAFLLYTSGTTGRPKGAVLTHVNLVHSVMHFALAMDLADNERSVAAVPLSHVTGLVAHLLAMLYCGGTLAILPEFKAKAFLQLAQDESMTHTVMVPAMYALCTLHADWPAARLASWRIAGYGGAPMPLPVIEQLASSLPHLCLVNAYGATETSSPTTLMPLAGGPHDSVGRAVECADLKVVDPETGQEQMAGRQGELWIRGPMVVPAYWNKAEATRESFVEGWWRSGDIASIGRDGFVRIHDRLKDMIIRGGYKIFGPEVESVLMRHPAVVEAAVVGTACKVLGERVRAFVTVGQDVSEAELRGLCAGLLSDYKVPEGIEISRQPLPRNGNGKVRKNVLREQAARIWGATS